MKDKQPMKINLLTAILLIIILVLCGAFFLYNSNEKISELEQELENLKLEYSAKLEENQNEDKQTETETSQNIIHSIFTATEKNKTQGMVYSFEETDEYLSIDIKNGIPYIRGYTSIPDLAVLVNVDKNQIKIKTNEYIEITGFSKKVINAHIGCIGQDVSGMTFVFLMEDGTVEYSTLSNMLTNVNTEGKIEGLNNIVSLHSSSVSDTINGGGYVTIVALDSENYFYNLNDYL